MPYRTAQASTLRSLGWKVFLKISCRHTRNASFRTSTKLKPRGDKLRAIKDLAQLVDNRKNRSSSRQLSSKRGLRNTRRLSLQQKRMEVAAAQLLQWVQGKRQVRQFQLLDRMAR